MTDHTCTTYNPNCHRCIIGRDEVEVMEEERIGVNPWGNQAEHMTWAYGEIVDLMHYEVYLTPNQRRKRLFEIAKVVGAYSTQPTDLSAHVHCDLSVDIVVTQTYRAHVSPEDPDVLLMPAAERAHDEMVDRIERIWCIDHERVVGEDRINNLTMEWS